MFYICPFTNSFLLLLFYFEDIAFHKTSETYCLTITFKTYVAILDSKRFVVSCVTTVVTFQPATTDS